MSASARRLDAIRRHLGQEFGAGGGELDDLAAILRTNLSDLRDRMYAALREREWCSLSSMGYSIRSLGVNIGQAELEELGAGLEAAASEGDQAKLKGIVVRIDAVLEECVA